VSQIENINTPRALRGRANLEEAHKALKDPALRRIGLGTEFNGFDTKRKNETAADARVKLHAAWGASLAGRLFVVNSADVDVRSILDNPTERGLHPPFDITPIFVTGFDGGTCPLFIVKREAEGRVSVTTLLPSKDDEGFLWSVVGGTNTLRTRYVEALLKTVTRQLKPVGPQDDSATAGPDAGGVSLNEARRELTEGSASFRFIGKEDSGKEDNSSDNALQFIKEATREARAGRLFVVENLPLTLTDTLAPDCNDAIRNGALRPPFTTTFILATIKGLPEGVCLLGVSGNCFSTPAPKPGYESGCLHPERLKNGDIVWKSPDESKEETLGDIIAVILSLIADARSPVARVEAPDKLNKARAKRGKPPIPPYWRIEPPKPTVLVPNAARDAVATKSGGTHASPRPHERRGHPRHLSGDRTVWVRSARVNALIPHLTRDRAYYEIKLR
jgi:hypothetical protein